MVRRMAQQEFLAEQRERVYDPHIRPVNELVDALVQERPGETMPYVAPHYDPGQACIVSLMSNPGPRAAGARGSGFISCENDDPTAQRIATVYADVGLAHAHVVPWNAHPWYVHDGLKNGLTTAYLADGIDPLVRLLDACPQVRVIVAHGGDAHGGVDLLARRTDILIRRGMTVLKTWHTGNLALAVAEPERTARLNHLRTTYLKAMRTAGLTAGPSRSAPAPRAPSGPDVRTPTPTAASLLQALTSYRAARRTLLDVMSLHHSNRDPIPEVAEHLVAALLGGTVAAGRVQPLWDVETPEGLKIQVRSLSNTGADHWVNEHPVRLLPGVDVYALVIFEDLTVSAVILLPQRLARLNQFLGKRHGEPDTTLQFTRGNFRRILDHRELLERDYGLRVWTGAQLRALR
ncbi:hypothetical protein [Georgenia yuyongxinii]